MRRFDLERIAERGAVRCEERIARRYEKFRKMGRFEDRLADFRNT